MLFGVSVDQLTVLKLQVDRYNCSPIYWRFQDNLGKPVPERQMSNKSQSWVS